MKKVYVEGWDEEHIAYRLIDYDEHNYGVADLLDEEGKVYDTMVIDFHTYDEVEDSDLWKRIIQARANEMVTLEELLAREHAN
jgi:hypothetical protein